jgi:hypothetical protein
MDTFWFITFILLGFYILGRVANVIQGRELQREEDDRENARRARIDALYGKRTEESYDDGT